MAIIRIKIGAALDPGATAVFAPLIAAAAKARAAVAAEGRKGAEEFVGGYRTSGRKAKAGIDDVTKAVTEGADKQAAAAKRASDKWLAEANRATKMRIRFAKEEAAAVESSLAKQQAMVRSAITKTASGVASLGRMGVGLVSSIARGAGVNMDAGAVVGKVVGQQAAATTVANSGYVEGAEGAAGKRQDPSKIIADARGAADAAAVSTDVALAGLQKFVGRTTDLATGRAILGDMAKQSKAMGSNMEDVMDSAGLISVKLGDIPNKAQVVVGLMSTIAQQGKDGSTEMAIMAKEIGKFVGPAKKFGEGEAKATVELGALFQTLTRSGVKAAVASTSVQSFVGDLTSKAGLKSLHGGGVQDEDIFTDKTKSKLKPLADIIPKLFDRTGSDLTKISALLTNKRSGAVLQSFQAIYAEGEKKEKGGGNKAIQAEIKRYSKETSVADQAGALGAAMSTTESKVQLFNNALERVAEESLPKLIAPMEKLAPVAVDVARALGEVVGFAAEHPAAAVVAAIGAVFAKQVAASALSSAFMSATSSASSFGFALGALSAATYAAYFITEKMNKDKEKGEDKVAAEVADRNKVINKAAKEAKETGKLTPETAAALAQAKGEIDADKAKAQGAYGSTSTRAGQWIRGEKSTEDLGAENEARARLPQLDAQSAAIKSIMDKAGMDPSKLAAAIAGQTLKVQVVGGGALPGGAGTTGPAPVR